MSKHDRLSVLIVGVGLGGLMLGALLEKLGVEYTIFERATAFKPLANPAQKILFGKRVWSISEDLDKLTIHTAENPTQSMCNGTRDFSIPDAMGRDTLGGLYDLTPKDSISKVMLEEKVFQTRHSGRVVLLGDAYHRLYSNRGQDLGAMAKLDKFHLHAGFLPTDEIKGTVAPIPSSSEKIARSTFMMQ
ncbi:hypothetical protein FBU30_004927 [Linnemannia zychae]|nr:hypothetical protein FBU30_004927 [Linnemannia zychae]